jgi:hypothetical protein
MNLGFEDEAGGGVGGITRSADSNGDCVFNGIDVIFSVNYLKGIGPAPRRCPDC